MKVKKWGNEKRKRSRKGKKQDTGPKSRKMEKQSGETYSARERGR